MSKDEGWIELEEGFYIVEESGSAHSGRQAGVCVNRLMTTTRL